MMVPGNMKELVFTVSTENNELFMARFSALWRHGKDGYGVNAGERTEYRGVMKSVRGENFYFASQLAQLYSFESFCFASDINSLFSTIWVTPVYFSCRFESSACVIWVWWYVWLIAPHWSLPGAMSSLFSCPASIEMYLFSSLQLDCCLVLNLPKSADEPPETAVNEFSISTHFPAQHVATAVKWSTFGFLPGYS